MKTIYKFALRLYIKSQVIAMPKDAVILSVGIQHNNPVIWASVNLDAPTEQRKIWLLETGTHFETTPGRFIGTIQINDEDNPYVLHCFEETK